MPASQAMTDNPPGSPGSDVDRGPESVRDVVLSTISMWVDKLPAREVEMLALKYFSFEKLREAVKVVKRFINCTMTQGEQVDLLARNLVGAVTKLGQSDEPIVEFLVDCKELFAVPGVESTLMPLDVSSVGARLVNMEVSLEALTASVQQIGNVAKSVDTLASVVTSLQEQQRQAVSAQTEVGGQVHQAVVQQQANVLSQAGNASYAAIAGRGAVAPAENLGKRKRGATSIGSPHQETPRRPNPATPPSALFQQALVQNGVQGLSQMLHDERQKSDEREGEGFTMAAGTRRWKRRQAKLLQGASEVQAGGGLPSPYSVFIRNTDPNYTEGDIKKYLEECASAMPEDEKLESGLKITHVCNIPIKRSDGAPPRSKCWKVTVDSEFKEHMMKAKAYPSSWSARQWYGNNSQKARLGLNVVAGADPSGAYCRPASKWSGPPGLYGRAAVERTEPLASKAGGPEETQAPQPHTGGDVSEAARLVTCSSMVVA